MVQKIVPGSSRRLVVSDGVPLSWWRRRSFGAVQAVSMTFFMLKTLLVIDTGGGSRRVENRPHGADRRKA
jgi:hypothetical protein